MPGADLLWVPSEQRKVCRPHYRGKTDIPTAARARLDTDGLRSHADERGYDFTGPTRFDKLFSGIVVQRP